MRFIFLGTGTSAGIPVIACSCRACVSPDPRDRRTRTGAAIAWTDPEGRDRVVLLDATPDLRIQALRHNILRCDAIFFTHNHVDHIFGLDEVRRFNAVMRTPIDIFADAHTLDSLRRVYTHIFNASANINKSFVATLLSREVRPMEPVTLYGLRFTPIRLLHGRQPILGYRIDAADSGSYEKHTTQTAEPLRSREAGLDATSHASAPRGWLPLAYCTDVSAIPPETWPALVGVRTLVLDALRHRHHPTHLTLDQAVGIAEHVAAEQTFFIHMGHEVVHDEVQAELPDGVALAYDGLVLD